MQSWGRWICARVAGEVLGLGLGDDELGRQLECEGHRVVAADTAKAGDLPFDEGSFDTVLIGDFLAEWASRDRPIAEARRVLRPGGRLIIATPYAADSGGDGVGISLGELLGELGELSVSEIATIDGKLCLLAERRREKSRATVWRRALGIAEERLAGNEAAARALSESVSELSASREREERALAHAQGNVERLEMALAAATHRRDLEQEKARLAAEGVVELQRRVERLNGERAEAEQQRQREVAKAERERERQVAEIARELAEARVRLEERQAELKSSRAALQKLQHELAALRETLKVSERHLKTAQLEAESRDHKLEAVDRALESRDAEVERLHRTVGDHQRKLALAEARLQKAEQRAEHFRGSLVAIREGHAYGLMRILWRLRRPFRRAPHDAVRAQVPSADDTDPTPPAAAAPAPTPEPARTVTHVKRVSAPRPQGDRLRVASILDEMSEACFAPECELVPLALEGWRGQLDDRGPDLLLVESAWNGNGGEWQYRIAQYPRQDLAGLPALRALIDGCHERGIPTAFWNKEDPIHFDRFSEAASLFDHVFTTDARCVERYRDLPGERTVAPLPFAAQPRIHNPAAAVPERSASPCFAGAWYRDRHPERRRALETLLDAARPYGLVIYDRRFGGSDDAFGFPERFAPHVLGRLPYERIVDVYKGHRVFLNANSVVDSPTMCSRRVFELAACDTAILSTPGAALSALLGEGLIEEAGDEETAAAALERMLGDDAERRRRTRAARRAVFAEHTYAERLATIAGVAGVDASSLRREPFSANGTDGRRPWLLALQPGTALSETALADLAAATAFADADVIGIHPARNGDPAVEHRRTQDLDPRALLVRRKLIESRGRLPASSEEIHTRLRQWSDDGVRLYAADADLLAV